MVPSRARRAPGPPRPRPPFLELGFTAPVAAVATLVFQHATHYYFNADDFDGLARARGLLPPRPDLARFLPWHVFFPACSTLFGLDPAPYHVVSLLTHALASALVFAWILPLTGPWSALVGAVFYAAHPVHFGSTYWIAAISDPLATTFALTALLLLRKRGPARWLALPAFAAALLSKECALLVPVVAWCEPRPAADEPPAARARAAAAGRPHARGRAFRDPVVAAMLGLSVLVIAYYASVDPFATRRAGAEAYLPTLGPHVFANLVTYAGWTSDFVVGSMHSMSDAVEPAVFPWGIAALALGLMGVFDPGLRRRGWLAGLALWLTMLAPVLPLAHHTYRYYLTGPLAGAALCVASLTSRVREMAFGKTPPRVAAPAVGFLLAALLAWNGAELVARLEFAPFTRPGLRADATVDRALIAERAITALRDAELPDGVVLRFWSPLSRADVGLPDSVDRESYWEKNVRTALLDGLGVRVALPAVRRVEFVPRFIPAGDSVWYAVYREDGSLKAGPASGLAQALGVRKD